MLGPVLAPEKELVTLSINYLYLDQVLGLFSFCFLPPAPTLPRRGEIEQLGGHLMSRFHGTFWHPTWDTDNSSFVSSVLLLQQWQSPVGVREFAGCTADPFIRLKLGMC